MVNSFDDLVARGVYGAKVFVASDEGARRFWGYFKLTDAKVLCEKPSSQCRYSYEEITS